MNRQDAPVSDKPITVPPYWNQSPDELFVGLRTSPQGLTATDAQERLAKYGPNRLKSHQNTTFARLFFQQLKNPLVLILVFAASISFLTQDWIESAIVLTVLLASALLSAGQEYNAGNAVARLRDRAAPKATVLRHGASTTIPAEEVVPGDIVLLSAGSLIPADGLVLEADDFFVNQAVLTGETYPAEKRAGIVPADTGLNERTNSVFQGTSVRSGSARALIVATGAETAFGQIAEKLTLRPPETEFERGIRQFGDMLARLMTLLVLIVFAANVLLNKPVLDSLLFSVALAVGITPELLPAIVSITLAQGTQRMAQCGVIVRQLTAIENLGSLDILCTDKTGTLTVGVMKLDGAFNPQGEPSDTVFRYAYLNASLQTGLTNPLDEAITANPKPDIDAFVKTEEIPYDFVRKCLTIAVRDTGKAEQSITLLTKGAFANILAVCTQVQGRDDTVLPLDKTCREELEGLFAKWSDQGFRVLGLATKLVAPQSEYTTSDESDMIFTGFLLFFDPPKPDAQKAIADLCRMGITLKVITGDNSRVATHIAQAVGLEITGILTGPEINRLPDEALWRQVNQANLFADVDPNQKERLIIALQKTGHVVGYLGDGINDAPALHAGDVGISVDTAVDVAKEAADFVLLEHSLDVLRQGIEEGRRTFANTLKYVYTTTSANFGNMLSMAILSPFLPFLPLLPIQILLNNFLSDFPAMAVSADSVDAEMVERPRRWDIREIRRFMVLFGLVSSVFDGLTFAALLMLFRAGEAQFHTAWFIESLLTELLILLIVRTRRPLLRSHPGRLLWQITLAVGVIAVLLPYLPPLSALFQLTQLPLPTLLSIFGILILYVIANEIAKRFFFRVTT